MSFNINTNDWVKRYIFKRIITHPKVSKSKMAKEISQLISLLFLALWHGYSVGYFLCFLLEFLLMMAENAIKALTSPLHIPDNGMTRVLAWIIRNIALSYGLISFDLKTFGASIHGYNNLYWFGHIIGALVIVAAKMVVKQPRKKTE